MASCLLAWRCTAKYVFALTNDTLSQALELRRTQDTSGPHHEILSQQERAPHDRCKLTCICRGGCRENHRAAISKADGLDILYDKKRLPLGTQALQPGLEAFQAQLGWNGQAHLQQVPIS